MDIRPDFGLPKFGIGIDGISDSGLRGNPPSVVSR
jgi:hypothetical protein